MRTSTMLRRARNEMMSRGIVRGSFESEAGGVCSLGALRIVGDGFINDDVDAAASVLYSVIPIADLAKCTDPIDGGHFYKSRKWIVARYHDSSTDQRILEMWAAAIEVAERDELELDVLQSLLRQDESINSRELVATS